METKKCLKCLSNNSSDAAYCRFCHEKFNYAKTFVEKKERRRLSRKMLVAGGGLLAATAGYIFKRKARDPKKKQAG